VYYKPAVARSRSKTIQPGTQFVSAGVLRCITAELEAIIDVSALLTSEDISREALQNDAGALVRVLDRVAYATGDHGFALRAGHRAGVGIFGAVEYAARTTSTLGEALAILTRHFSKLSTLVDVSLTSQATATQLCFRVTDDIPVSPWLPEFTLAAIVRSIRDAIGPTWNPSRVQFRHAAHGNESDCQKTLGCPVDFALHNDALHIATTDLLRPLLTSNPTVERVLVTMIEDEHRQLSLAESSVDDIRLMLNKVLHRGRSAASSLARDLRVNIRTLQRRVSELGFQLSDLLEEQRKHKAIELLTAGRQPIVDIARALGFASVAAFSRAFVRWTGELPHAVRLRSKG
jgi:AraC-like DNA-binding protein